MGLAALAMLAGAAQAADKSGKRAPQRDDRATLTIVNDDAVLASSGDPVRPGLRAPSIGGGCQQNGNFNTALNIAAGGGATTGFTSNVLTTSFSRADNFRVGGTGVQSLTSVSWSGWSQNAGGGKVSSANTPFIITIWQSTNGAPGALVGSRVVTPTVTTPNNDLLGAIQVDDFTATFAAQPISLNAGECYWIEIRPNGALPATATNYIWRASNQGDGVYIRRTNSVPNYVIQGIVNGDLAFCLNVPTLSMANADQCSVGSDMACFGAANSACQVWDGTTSAQGSNAFDDIAAADNFTINAPAAITRVCWQGVWVIPENGGVVPTVNDFTPTFTINIYRDQGGANPGVPGAAPVATATVTGGTGGNLTFGAAPMSNIVAADIVVGTAPTRQRQSSRSFSADLTATPLNLTQPGCYWLEIVSTTGSTAQPIRFFWFNKANSRPVGIADGFRQQRGGTPYSQATQLRTGDFSWCLTGTQGANPLTLVRSTDCVPAAQNPNVSCATAALLTVGAAPTTLYNTLYDLTDANVPPPCGAIAPTPAGAWFRVQGNGQELEVSTCESGTDPRASQTDHDTTIAVYCNQSTASCGGPFICLASNDDDATPCSLLAGASRVRFPTANGVTYYIYVSGFQDIFDADAARGYFYVAVRNSGAGAVAAPACSAVANCDIAVPAGAQAEAEPCGVAVNDTCTTPEVLALNAWATGTLDASSAGFDVDYWRLPAATDVANGGTYYTIELRNEMPMAFYVEYGACTAGATVGFSGFIRGTCAGAGSFTFFAPAGPAYVVAIPYGTGGPQCDPLLRGNRYAFRVSLAPVGVCCVPGSNCSVTVAGAAGVPTAFTGTARGCATRGGTYLGDGTTCQPGVDTFAPCDSNGFPAGGAPANAVVGGCCDPFGACSIVVQGQCPAGSAFTVGTAACTPNPCTTVLARRCCFTSGACLVSETTACTAAGGTVVTTSTSCTPNSCTQGTLGVCCGATGACFVGFQGDCPVTVQGVSFQAGVTACTPNVTCPPGGSCCFNGSSVCLVAIQSVCASFPNTAWTSGGTCGAGSCVGTAPLGDACTAARTISGNGQPIHFGTDLAANEGPVPPAGSCNAAAAAAAGLDNSAFFVFTAPSAGSLRVQHTTHATYDAVMVLYSGADCASLVERTGGCFDEPEPFDTTVQLAAGERITIAVGDFGTADGGGWNSLTVTFTGVGGGGVCCRGSVCETNVADCSITIAGSQAGAVTASGSSCNATGDTDQPCCKADYNKANNVDLLDIFAFLTDWFAGVPFTNHNGDVNAVGDLLDIFSFLEDWFNGPCPTVP